MRLTLADSTLGMALQAAVAVIVVVAGLGILGAATGSGAGAVAVTGGSTTLGLPMGADIAEHTSTSTTLGTAAGFDGTGGNVSADVAGPDVSDSEWSLTTYASANASISQARSVLGYEHIAISYQPATTEWRAYVYNPENRTETVLSLPAPDPQNATLLAVSRENDTLRFTRNGTANTTTLDGAGYHDAPPTASWYGTVEETRVYPYALNDSQLQELIDNSTLAVAGPAPSARVNYDARDKSASTVPVFFAGGEASLNGVTLTEGHSGPDITDGVDYSWGGRDNATVSVFGPTLESTGEIIYTEYNLAGGGGYVNAFISPMMALLLLGAIGIYVREQV